MAFKDYASLGISSLALLLSSATAYYATFSERQNVSAVLTDDYLNLGAGNGTIGSVRFDARLVIINSGNRPLALTDLGLSVYQVAAIGNITDCDVLERHALHNELLDLESPFQPTIVRPLEVSIIPITFRRRFADDDGSARVGRPGAANRFRPASGDQQGHIRLAACLDFEVATPGDRLRRISRLIGYVDAETLGPGTGGTQGTPGPLGAERTASLIRESRLFQ